MSLSTTSVTTSVKPKGGLSPSRPVPKISTTSHNSSSKPGSISTHPLLRPSISSLLLLALAALAAPSAAGASVVLGGVAVVSSALSASSQAKPCVVASPIPGNPILTGPKAGIKAHYPDVDPDMLTYEGREAEDSLWGERHLLGTGEDKCEREGAVVGPDGKPLFFKESWARHKFNDRIQHYAGLKGPDCKLSTILDQSVMTACKEMSFIDAVPYKDNLPERLRSRPIGKTHRADWHFPIANPDAPKYSKVVGSIVAQFALIPESHFDDVVMTVTPYGNKVAAGIDLDGIASPLNTFKACKYISNILWEVPVSHQVDVIGEALDVIRSALKIVNEASLVYDPITIEFISENRDNFWPFLQNFDDADPSIDEASFDALFEDLIKAIRAAGSFRAFIVSRTENRLNYIYSFLKSVARAHFGRMSPDMIAKKAKPLYIDRLDEAYGVKNGRFEPELVPFDNVAFLREDRRIQDVLVAVLMGIERIHAPEPRSDL